jgi:raffinose/stachyose/melibiose transport system permease protein
MKFAALPLAIFTVVLVVPFVNGFYYTFTDWDGFKVDKFVGLSNYQSHLQIQNFGQPLDLQGSLSLSLLF